MKATREIETALVDRMIKAMADQINGKEAGPVKNGKKAEWILYTSRGGYHYEIPKEHLAVFISFLRSF